MNGKIFYFSRKNDSSNELSFFHIIKQNHIALELLPVSS